MLKEFIERLDKLPQKILADCVEINADRPLIGIICAQNELTASHNALNELCQRVRDGVAAADATAKIAYVASVDGTALHGTAAAKYDLPSRDLTAANVELLCSAEFFDGLVFVASEPNTVCGMLLGAIRLNLPCAFVCQGVMTPFTEGGRQHGFVSVYKQIAQIKTGRISYEDIRQIEENLPIALGTDCERYGANSFNCLLEAAGLALRGNGTATAGSVERKKIATATGELAVRFAKSRWTPRRALSRDAINNLITLDLACGGSSTTMLNLLAVAKEVGARTINFKAIGEAAKHTPVLLVHSDDRAIMPQFHKAGGVYAMLRRLLEAELVNGKVSVADGTTLEELVKDAPVADGEVIRSADKCVSANARLRILYGNVAEAGAIVHCGCKGNSFTGPAKVYQDEETAVDALLHREIKTGDVMIIRGEGPKSGPGMREIYVSLALLEGYGLAQNVAVVTDGRIADFYSGFAVGHVTPETGEQNVFSVLQDGDEIEINLTKGKVSLDIKAKDLNQRYRLQESTGSYGGHFLKSWAKNCAPATEGCVYKPSK